MLTRTSPIKGIIRSLGLVFGDIGTSPIYTLTVVFLLLEPTRDNVMGILSLVFWTMTILVSAEYAWLATSLSKKGEGGTIVLREILIPMLKSGRKVSVVVFLSYIGISLIIGDGIITPAISILSAVEGMKLIPAMSGMGHGAILTVAATIAIILFSFQYKGTERVAGIFGPIMVVWFGVLLTLGIVGIRQHPEVLMAVSPTYAINFMLDSGWAGFVVLSEVILCATGGEALYADMGHLGRAPIIRSWMLVFVALFINYFGQGAFLLGHPDNEQVLFGMVYHFAQALYIPFLILSVMATVIASQAMISGMFSVVYQAMNTGIMPLLKIDYTSEDLKSQIYIGAVNWFLLLFVLFIMFLFKESSKLAAAYGLAVTGTMTLTGIMMTWIFRLRKQPWLALAAFAIFLVDIVYFTSVTTKIPHGGYWSIIIAMLPFTVIMVYTKGQQKLYRCLNPMSLREFLAKFNELYSTKSRLEGQALYFIRDVNVIPPYISRTVFTNGIIYDTNIFVAIIKRDDPFGVTSFFRDDLAPGLRVFEIQMGYMEVVDISELLREGGINERAIFYGIEDVSSDNIFWRFFHIIKKLAPSFVQFHKLPSDKLHGVITRVEM